MIVKEDFLKQLRSVFDLNIYEAKIWTALLSKGIATAGELADISNVPRSRCYDVLETLEKKGYVIMKIGKPIKYLAVQPKDVVARVKNGIEKQKLEQIRAIEKVKDTSSFSELELLFKQGIQHVKPDQLSGSVKGRDNLHDHLSSMLNKAKESVIIMTTASGLERKAEILNSMKGRLKKNNVSVKIAAPLAKVDKKILESLRDVAEVKDIDKINARFIIVDKKDVLFMINNDKDVHESYDSGIWVDTPYFAEALGNLFELNWR